MSTTSGATAAPAAAAATSASAAPASFGFAAPAPTPPAAAPVPRDARALQALLAAHGLQPGQYQSRVIAQLLEFQTRYCREILEEAQDYCQHSGKAFIDIDDIELAVQNHLSTSFVSPPPRELLYSLAAARNSVPLPIVPSKEGVHLPPDRFALLAPNYRVKDVAAGKGAGARRDAEHKSS